MALLQPKPLDSSIQNGGSKRGECLAVTRFARPQRPAARHLAGQLARLLWDCLFFAATHKGLPGYELEHLAPRYRLGLASGSRHSIIRAVLSLEKLQSCFSAVASSEDVAHGKPAPDIFLRTAELLEVPPSACCVIEDSVAGVEATLAAGMAVIAITNTFPGEKLSRATHVVGNYEAIERLLLAARQVA